MAHLVQWQKATGDEASTARGFTVPDREQEVVAMVVEARRLGDAWVADECGFCDVTLGVAGFAQRLRRLERPSPAGPVVGRALLAPIPGDQHSFGIALLAMRMREAGWEVVADVGPELRDLIDAAGSSDVSLIGLSVGYNRALGRTAEVVRALRRVSRRRAVTIALGGPMLNGQPELARRLGADLHADDAETLVRLVTPPASLAA